MFFHGYPIALISFHKKQNVMPMLTPEVGGVLRTRFVVLMSPPYFVFPIFYTNASTCFLWFILCFCLLLLANMFVFHRHFVDFRLFQIGYVLKIVDRIEIIFNVIVPQEATNLAFVFTEGYKKSVLL